MYDDKQQGNEVGDHGEDEDGVRGSGNRGPPQEEEEGEEEDEVRMPIRELPGENENVIVITIIIFIRRRRG